jgi:multimeric flavodoxin WrbA
MKILALVGSFRKKGNSARIVTMFKESMEQMAMNSSLTLDFETLYLGEMHILMCRGCRACFDSGEDTCPLNDDIPLIRSKMDAADALILAGPVYVDNVSGLVKNWMDRLAYLCHRPAMGGKCAVSVATVGGGSTSHALRTMNSALLTWGYQLSGKKGFAMGALTPAEELPRYQPAVDKTAQRLFNALTRKKALHPGFLSLMVFKIQQMAWQKEAAGSWDYNYWQSRGWLTANATFYSSHRVHPLKVAAARLAGAIVFRFVAK